MGVHVGKAVLGQLVGKAGADDLRAVQTEHGIHDGTVLVGRNQLLCHGSGLGKTGLLGSDVDVIVDVAVAGGEVALCHAQEQVAFLGGKLYHVDHRNSTPFFRFFGSPLKCKKHRIPAMLFHAFLYPYCTEKRPCAQGTKQLKCLGCFTA